MLHFILDALRIVGYLTGGLYFLVTLFCLALAVSINWRAALLPLALLVEAVFFVLGLVAVPIAAALGAYVYRPSERYSDRIVRSWSVPWLWMFGNEEDGIDGEPLRVEWPNLLFKNGDWTRVTNKWSDWRRIVTWAAFRNSASNLRFTKWGFLLDPRKVVVHMNSSTEWFVSHGWRSTYWYQGRRWRAWIGWNLKPWDRSPFATALPEGDPRSAGVGFKFQLKRAR